ncbi:c-type cytochrome [Paroceanicella profunda]|uniref:C-type cytochrome n=1 Tax=Paroceanicella profunda TaxID=2579971 RepID=A0A5B8FXW4_9RHOB|nr:c-type cytochrome [Paroceanicella profunda]
MLKLAAGALVLAAGAAWALSAPETVEAGDLPAYTADAARGAHVFTIGGCASCHAAEGAGGDARLVLSGGRAIVSEFGTFHVPNISPDPEHGIGGWSEAQFVAAMLHGTSPEGRHYYPAFPYTSYARMRVEDLRDLFAYLRTLPASDRADTPHDIPFPFSVNRAIGLWKLLYLSPDPVVPMPGADPLAARGRYLAEGPGHCGECHTRRDLIGGPVTEAWLGGGPNPDGAGRIPNLTPGGPLGSWSASDIAYYLESGFTPDYDSVGGAMADVVRNTAALPAEDRAALAAYIKALPPVLPEGAP